MLKYAIFSYFQFTLVKRTTRLKKQNYSSSGCKTLGNYEKKTVSYLFLYRVPRLLSHCYLSYWKKKQTPVRIFVSSRKKWTNGSKMWMSLGFESGLWFWDFPADRTVHLDAAFSWYEFLEIQKVLKWGINFLRLIKKDKIFSGSSIGFSLPHFSGW